MVELYRLLVLGKLVILGNDTSSRDSNLVVYWFYSCHLQSVAQQYLAGSHIGKCVPYVIEDACAQKPVLAWVVPLRTLTILKQATGGDYLWVKEDSHNSLQVIMSDQSIILVIEYSVTVGGSKLPTLTFSGSNNKLQVAVCTLLSFFY